MALEGSDDDDGQLISIFLVLFCRKISQPLFFNICHAVYLFRHDP